FSLFAQHDLITSAENFYLGTFEPKFLWQAHGLAVPGTKNASRRHSGTSSGYIYTSTYIRSGESNTRSALLRAAGHVEPGSRYERQRIPDLSSFVSRRDEPGLSSRRTAPEVLMPRKHIGGAGDSAAGGAERPADDRTDGTAGRIAARGPGGLSGNRAGY